MSYFQGQIQEIKNDTALRLYGAFLAFCNVLSAIYWIKKENFHHLSNAGEALCWPFFPKCFEYRFLDPQQVYGVLIAFGVASIVGTFLFLKNRLCGLAY